MRCARVTPATVLLSAMLCDVNFWHIHQRQTETLNIQMKSSCCMLLKSDPLCVSIPKILFRCTTLALITKWTHLINETQGSCVTRPDRPLRIVRFAKAFAVCLLPSTPAWWTRMARSSWRQTTLSRSISDCTLRFTTTPKLCSSLLLWPTPQRMGTYWLHMCKHTPVYLDSDSLQRSSWSILQIVAACR